MSKVVDRASEPHPQHKGIADTGESECRLDVSGPARRDGIVEDRPEVLLLAWPVEAELMRVAEHPDHLEPITQPLKRECRGGMRARHACHSCRALVRRHRSKCRLPKHPPGIAEVVFA